MITVAPRQVVAGDYRAVNAGPADRSLWLDADGVVTEITTRSVRQILRTPGRSDRGELATTFSWPAMTLVAAASEAVTAWDVDGHAVWRLSGGEGAFASAVCGGAGPVWCLSHPDGALAEVKALDPRTGQVLASIRLGDPTRAGNGWLQTSPGPSAVLLVSGDGQGDCACFEIALQNQELRARPLFGRGWMPISSSPDGDRILTQSDERSGLALWSYPEAAAVVMAERVRLLWGGGSEGDGYPGYEGFFLDRPVGSAGSDRRVVVQEYATKRWFVCSATDLVPFDEVVVSGFEPGPKPGLSDWYSPVLSLRRHGGAVVGRAVGPDGPALLAFSATDFTAAASSPGDRRPGHSPRRP